MLGFVIWCFFGQSLQTIYCLRSISKGARLFFRADLW